MLNVLKRVTGLQTVQKDFSSTYFTFEKINSQARFLMDLDHIVSKVLYNLMQNSNSFFSKTLRCLLMLIPGLYTQHILFSSRPASSVPHHRHHSHCSNCVDSSKQFCDSCKQSGIDYVTNFLGLQMRFWFSQEFKS